MVYAVSEAGNLADFETGERKAMSWLSNDIVEILTFLLPGFIAAAVFYSLTSHPRPSEFTMVVQAIVFLLKRHE